MTTAFYPSDAHREATILDRLEFADALVHRIGPERVRSISTELVLHPTSRDDGHAIAAELVAAGATIDIVHSEPTGVVTPDHPGFTAYEMTVDGRYVQVFASYRAAALAVAS